MITEIGIVAGDIWHCLEKCSTEIELNELAKCINQPRDLVLMSVGWLGREGHVIVRQADSTFYVQLRKG